MISHKHIILKNNYVIKNTKKKIEIFSNLPWQENSFLLTEHLNIQLLKGYKTKLKNSISSILQRNNTFKTSKCWYSFENTCSIGNNFFVKINKNVKNYFHIFKKPVGDTRF